jgi:PDZ domain/Trypsin-like peptidase domain
VCVTNGSVCRIQHQEYTHSEVELLSLETTAHIAHGNSGGPVLNKDGEVVGIAFQGTDRVGEFIPHCVFSRFLQVDEKTKMGEIQSVAGLSFLWQKLENKTFRRSLGLDNMEGNNRSGIYVSSVDAFGAVAGVLQVGDVIVEMEGVSVGNVGTILLQGNRIGFMHLITSRAVGDIIHVGVVRDGVRLNVEWSLSSADVSYLVPKYDRLKNRGLPPDYVVIGGLVFCSFSKQLFHSLGGAHSHLYHLLEALDFGRKEQEDDEYVVLSRLLPNEAVNLGYSSAELESRRVCSLNGTKVRNLRHFADLYRESEGPYLRIDLTIPSFPSATTLVLDRELIAEEEANILEEYQVPKWCRLSSDAAEDGSKSSNSSASEDGEGMADNAVAERSSELGKGYESADDSSVTSPVVCSKCGCNPADAGSDFTGESAREYT